jgi:hypothetical protein
MARSAARQVPDIALRFRTLFRRLGPGLDGPGGFGDAWYCILEGPSEIAVAEAQARALVDLLASHVTAAAAGAAPPQVLLAVDEFSAVSRRLPIWQLYERARSLGLAVQVSAQSWHGLAVRQDDRYRLAATAEGGIWLMRTPHPDPVVALAGRRASTDSTRQLAGWLRWRRQGTSRLGQRAVADPDLVRRLEVGQSAYIYRGGVTYIQVKRLDAADPARPGRPAEPGSSSSCPADGPDAVQPEAPQAGPPAGVPRGEPPGRLADIAALLDEAFGPSPCGPR